MRVISYSDARSQLKQVIDQVVADSDITVIARRDANNAVLMSLDTYNSMVETMHLLRSPSNARHLAKSIAQYQKGYIEVKGVHSYAKTCPASGRVGLTTGLPSLSSTPKYSPSRARCAKTAHLPPARQAPDIPAYTHAGG